jgi:serine/threonine-protein kinase RsbW
MKQKKFEIEVKNTIDSLPVISDFLEDTLSRFGADPGTINRVQLAVDEASTNVIRYAYPAEGAGILRITLEFVNDEMTITLTDWGKPFDPNTIPPPDLDANVEDRRIGGLGIYFMKKLMDSVVYSFDAVKGNQLVLKKKLKQG